MKPLLSISLILLLTDTLYAAEPKCVDPYDRAGHPHCQHFFAKPSSTPHYSGGYVGGGAVWRGNPRCESEGTWGWDYSGVLPIKHIWLDWSHQRYQAGGGKYHTDGPRLR